MTTTKAGITIDGGHEELVRWRLVVRVVRLLLIHLALRHLPLQLRHKGGILLLWLLASLVLKVYNSIIYLPLCMKVSIFELDYNDRQVTIFLK
jgi:hypothetical protein